MEQEAKKVIFIYNPVAGRGRIKKNLTDIASSFTFSGYDFSSYATKYKGDGARFIKESTESYDLYMTAGGDGTLSEIAGALIEKGIKAPIGYIPVGSANDFGHSMGIPANNIMGAVQNIIRGDVTRTDVGYLNNKMFVYVAAFGALTDVPYATPQKFKKVWGYLAYVFQAFKSFFPIRHYHLKIEHDGGVIEGNFVAGIISNSFYVGHFKSILSRETKLDDGKLEVLLVKRQRSVLKLARCGLCMLQSHFDEDTMVKFTTSKMTITSDDIHWDLDGEDGGVCNQATVTVGDRQLHIVTSNPKRRR